jgi:hypothetical protein
MAIHRVGDHASTPPVGPFRSWNFAKSKTLPSSLDFARNSTAKYWDGKSTVLSEQNLIRSSSTMPSSWGFSQLQYTSGITDFEGGSTALRIQENNVNNWHYMLQFSTAYNGGLFLDGPGRYCYSIIAKQNAGTRWLLLRPFDTTAYNAYFDLNTGNVGTVSGGVTAHMQALGDGWYKCSMSYDFPNTPRYYQLMMVSGDNVTQYQGDNGTSKFDICAPAVEYGVYKPGIYVPTATNPIKRAGPKMMTAVNNEPVFEHDPVTGHSLGIRQESARTNLIGDSEARTGVNYIGSGGYVEYQTGVLDPEGKQGTVHVFRATNPSVYNVCDLYTSGQSQGNVYTSSVYLKAIGDTTGIVRLQSSQNGGFYAYLDIDFSRSDGADPIDTVTSSAPTDGTTALTGNDSAISYHAEKCGGGWYRVGVTYNITTSTSGNIYRLALIADSGRNKNHGVAIWGYQVEAGYSMSSYMPNGATRAQDATLYPAGRLEEKAFTEDKGSFLVKYKVNQPTNTFPRLFSSDQGNDLICAVVATENAGTMGHTYFQAYNPETQTIQAVNPTPTKQENYVGFSWDDTRWDGVTNGVAASHLTPTGTFELNTEADLDYGIGHAPSVGTRDLNGTISKMSFYDYKLTQAQLEAITED